MKPITFLILLMSVSGVLAQVEILPREESQGAALRVNQMLGDDINTPFPLPLDLLNPHAIKGGQSVILAVPVHGLKELLTLQKDGESVPAGQLWMTGAVPEKEGRTADLALLRLINVEADGNPPVSAALYYLKVKRTGENRTLQFYTNGEEPLMSIALKPLKSPQEAPIELDGRAEGERGFLTLFVGELFEGALVLHPAP